MRLDRVHRFEFPILPLRSSRGDTRAVRVRTTPLRPPRRPRAQPSPPSRHTHSASPPTPPPPPRPAALFRRTPPVLSWLSFPVQR